MTTWTTDELEMFAWMALKQGLAYLEKEKVLPEDKTALIEKMSNRMYFVVKKSSWWKRIFCPDEKDMPSIKYALKLCITDELKEEIK